MSTGDTKRQAMKATMMEKMDALVEEYLDWYEQRDDLKFREIEEEILQLRKRMGAKLTEVAVEAEGQVKRGGKVLCPKCGREMRRKGMKEKTVVSLVGEVKMNREYYYCPHCHSGHFPPGRPNGTGEGME